MLALITQTFGHKQSSHNSATATTKLQYWPGMESSVRTTVVVVLSCLHLPTVAWRKENSAYAMKYTTGIYPYSKPSGTEYSDTLVSEKRKASKLRWGLEAKPLMEKNNLGKEV